MTWNPSRREFVVSAAKLTTGLGIAGLVPAAAARPILSKDSIPSAAQAPGEALRVAHLTDMHIQPELRGGEGVAACLKHMMEQRPALLLTGGDHLMDIFAQPEQRAKDLWTLYHKTIADHTGLTPKSCIGNHDIWGWNKGKSKTSGEEAKWGKLWSLDGLRLDKRYYSFDQGGWKFIALDTIHPDPVDGNGYLAGTDDEQFDWLSSTLRDCPATTPVLLYSHAPIVNAETLFGARTPEARKLEVSGGLICRDNLRLLHLFKQYPNVKLCLSGHVHNVERVDLHGVTFLCNGAVSGAWWEGKARQKPTDKPRLARCDEGYAILDLYADGTFKHEYKTYGWQA